MKVFVSHSAKDKAFVEEHIVDFLKRNGVPTWYSTDDIASASEWERMTRQAMKECDWFLVVLTPNSVASQWVRAEVHWAMEYRVDRIIPVLSEECDWQDLHLMMRTLQLVVLADDLEDGKSRLLSVWEKQLRPVVRQKVHSRVLDEPVVAVVDVCVSTLVYDPVAVGLKTAVSLEKRGQVELPPSLDNAHAAELVSIRSSVYDVELLFSLGNLLTLYFHVDNDGVLAMHGGEEQVYSLPDKASSICDLHRSDDMRVGCERMIGCENGTLCVFTPNSFDNPLELDSHDCKVSALVATYKSVVASGDVEGRVNIWAQSDFKRQGCGELGQAVHTIALESKHSQLMASVGDGEICALNYRGEILSRDKVASRPIVQLISLSESLVVFRYGKRFGLWDPRRRKVLGKYQPESQMISAMISRGGPWGQERLLAGCEDGSLIEYSIADPRTPLGRV
jgi:hypothetical protein